MKKEYSIILLCLVMIFTSGCIREKTDSDTQLSQHYVLRAFARNAADAGGISLYIMDNTVEDSRDIAASISTAYSDSGTISVPVAEAGVYTVAADIDNDGNIDFVEHNVKSSSDSSGDPEEISEKAAESDFSDIRAITDQGHVKITVQSYSLNDYCVKIKDQTGKILYDSGIKKPEKITESFSVDLSDVLKNHFDTSIKAELYTSAHKGFENLSGCFLSAKTAGTEEVYIRFLSSESEDIKKLDGDTFTFIRSFSDDSEFSVFLIKDGMESEITDEIQSMNRYYHKPTDTYYMYSGQMYVYTDNVTDTALLFQVLKGNSGEKLVKVAADNMYLTEKPALAEMSEEIAKRKYAEEEQYSLYNADSVEDRYYGQ